MLAPEPGEGRLRNIRQLTFGGNNAEAYFSASGRQIIFQRQEQLDEGCDQQYIMNPDGSGLRRVSSGLGRTTCGYFYDGDRRILYSSTFAHDPACPPRPDQRLGYVWPLGHFEIYSARPDGSDLRPLTSTGGAYNAEATVSPDGKTIIFTSTRDGDLELYTMAIDGSNVRRITHRVGYDGGAFFSPDGKRLSFTNIKANGLELWVADTATGQSRLVSGKERLNGTSGDSCDWLKDGVTLLCQLVPANRGPIPSAPSRPVLFPERPTMQKLKIFALMTGLTILLVGIGSYFGGGNGAVVMFVVSALMNFGSYWFSDKMVLKMYRAQIIDRSSAPELYGMVERLARQVLHRLGRHDREGGRSPRRAWSVRGLRGVHAPGAVRLGPRAPRELTDPQGDGDEHAPDPAGEGTHACSASRCRGVLL